ncbi:MAG: hypothetical protein P1P90_06675 [Patescibacteria group bacterium]|nr:hypothetical protein [Patescibacteria group bacterium]
MKIPNKVIYYPYRIPAKRKIKKTLVNRKPGLWYRIWPTLLVILGFGSATALVALEQMYKHGWFAINYGNYIATGIALCILLVLFIWYIQKTLYVYGVIRKPKNRH